MTGVAPGTSLELAAELLERFESRCRRASLNMSAGLNPARTNVGTSPRTGRPNRSESRPTRRTVAVPGREGGEHAAMRPTAMDAMATRDAGVSTAWRELPRCLSSKAARRHRDRGSVILHHPAATALA